MSKSSPTIPYAIIVPCDTIRISLIVVASNDIEVTAADILNAYVTNPVQEMVRTIIGSEFGSDTGKKDIIVRSLYVLKSEGESFLNYLYYCIKYHSYKLCLADPKLWYKAEVQHDGHENYAYILCYVGDILIISYDAMGFTTWLDK